MDYAEIKQVRRTTSDKEANELLGQGWKLINILSNGCEYYFLLVLC